MPLLPGSRSDEIVHLWGVGGYPPQSSLWEDPGGSHMSRYFYLAMDRTARVFYGWLPYDQIGDQEERNKECWRAVLAHVEGGRSIWRTQFAGLLCQETILFHEVAMTGSTTPPPPTDPVVKPMTLYDCSIPSPLHHSDDEVPPPKQIPYTRPAGYLPNEKMLGFVIP